MLYALSLLVLLTKQKTCNTVGENAEGMNINPKYYQRSACE